MKTSLVASILFLLASCTNRQHTKQQKAVKINFFDSIQQQQISFLDSLHLLKFNNTSKWFLYAIQCDDSSKSGRVRNRKELPRIPLGFMKLNLNYVSKHNDTLSLLYNFLYDDSTIVEKSTSNRPLIEGIQFNTTTNKIIGFIIGDAVLEQEGNAESRYENPLQPEVISFIKSNKDKLNPWFRDEAKRRKIIN